MTLKQLVDVLAYLKSLKGEPREGSGHHMHMGDSPKKGGARMAR